MMSVLAVLLIAYLHQTTYAQISSGGNNVVEAIGPVFIGSTCVELASQIAQISSTTGPSQLHLHCSVGTVIRVVKVTKGKSTETGRCFYDPVDSCTITTGVQYFIHRCSGHQNCTEDPGSAQYIESCNSFTNYITVEYECIAVSDIHSIDTSQVVSTGPDILGYIYLSSPLYPAHYPSRSYSTCNITTQPQSSINIRVLDFDIEVGNNGCEYDKLVYYNPTSGDYVDYCGRGKYGEGGTLDSDIISITFISDESVEQKGFMLRIAGVTAQGLLDSVSISCLTQTPPTIETEVPLPSPVTPPSTATVINLCQNATLTMSPESNDINQFYLSSPAYPAEYPHSANCSCQLTNMVASHRIEMELIYISIEAASQCEFDMLEIRPDPPGMRFAQRFCAEGVMSGYKMVSQNETMAIRFTSDSSVQQFGFLLIIKDLPPDDFLSSAAINLQCKASLPSDTTTTVPTLAPPSIPTLAPGTEYSDICGNTFGSTSQPVMGEPLPLPREITSPNYPQHYPSNTSCMCELRTRTSNPIRAVVHYFNLEIGLQNCEYDWFVLQQSPPYGEARRVCGHEYHERTFISGNNSLLMVFHSDGYINFPGFWITAEALSPSGETAVLDMRCHRVDRPIFLPSASTTSTTTPSTTSSTITSTTTSTPSTISTTTTTASSPVTPGTTGVTLQTPLHELTPEATRSTPTVTERSTPTMDPTVHGVKTNASASASTQNQQQTILLVSTIVPVLLLLLIVASVIIVIVWCRRRKRPPLAHIELEAPKPYMALHSNNNQNTTYNEIATDPGYTTLNPANGKNPNGHAAIGANSNSTHQENVYDSIPYDSTAPIYDTAAPVYDSAAPIYSNAIPPHENTVEKNPSQPQLQVPPEETNSSGIISNRPTLSSTAYLEPVQKPPPSYSEAILLGAQNNPGSNSALSNGDNLVEPALESNSVCTTSLPAVPSDSKTKGAVANPTYMVNSGSDQVLPISTGPSEASDSSLPNEDRSSSS
ncbi:uncharacterized protein LOC106161143 [Lingula anatina]|uniref:Uncharacterized protein LOC106161143 n=1 Tax=Lingula anatina TaxID=7574 RepID=A0A1S3I7W2_LINAN|nr:uncharacterized protein LOC106161143 [Lingula anatina]XP_013393464.1 uncharacterized protein LOC106161143 [Lingula anatina]XP_023931595.1 uncharacterized protein LOC106161143 [Lingula anatina]|eukprot:XP_013393463.1 uncharacterized protein LOC106161143 [Lingula anatina]